MSHRRQKADRHRAGQAGLEAIRARIARDNPSTADRFVLEPYAHLGKIAALGHSGVPRNDINPGLRLVVHGYYNIYFRVTPTETIIVRVLHSARDVRRLSFHEDPAPPMLPPAAHQSG